MLEWMLPCHLEEGFEMSEEKSSLEAHTLDKSLRNTRHFVCHDCYQSFITIQILFYVLQERRK